MTHTELSGMAKAISELARVEDFDSEQFDEQLARIQKQLGVTTGDAASMFFSHFDEARQWEEAPYARRVEKLINYVKFELDTLLNDF